MLKIGVQSRPLCFTKVGKSADTTEPILYGIVNDIYRLNTRGLTSKRRLAL